MTYTKKELFDEELQELAELCKILSHPARIAILNHLSECETCISGDITKEIPLSRTTVSQHLQELKNAGLIQGEIDGVKVNYCICNPILTEKAKKLINYLNKISIKQIKCC